MQIEQIDRQMDKIYRPIEQIERYNIQTYRIEREIEYIIAQTDRMDRQIKYNVILCRIDEKTKKGHDFAARVFVVKKTGLTPLSNKAVSYVFSSNNSVNEFWRSPYTKSSVDYVLSTTKDNINEWVTVKANVKEHFKKLHDLDVEELSGVAIMTDTDQTKIKAISYYQNIYFSSE